MHTCLSSPLCSIVGKNGSGKTTIIECLKMNTTGELPPNCRGGQAFVNDPNALGTSEARTSWEPPSPSAFPAPAEPSLRLFLLAQVKAQIKLRFTAATKKAAVCTRSFSLVQKPQKREYKAFENALSTMDANGQKQSLSYKAADLNKLVPEMMGVSTAVLESVVFVHQVRSYSPSPLSPLSFLTRPVATAISASHRRTRAGL